jgi:hypothetical protein
MRVAPHRLLFLLFFLFTSIAATSASADRQPILDALRSVREPLAVSAQYNYIMTARVHLLFFWAGKDGVGSGYIRRGSSSVDSHEEFFQVLFGSDPEKAPRAINRWGAGTEIAWHHDPVAIPPREDDVTASAFFGFMKSSRGKSVAEMQAELKNEQEHGLHSFTGILSRVEPARAFSLVVPLESDTDFTLHQYELAAPLMFDRIESSNLPVRSLVNEGRCPRASSFLATVAELLDSAVSGQRAPLSRCYVHDAQENTLTLDRTTPVTSLPVQLHAADKTAILDTTYANLLQLDFVSTHKLTSRKVYFTILVGTEGSLRGIPVQIRYQPNWWFQVVLNLVPGNPVITAPTLASVDSSLP